MRTHNRLTLFALAFLFALPVAAVVFREGSGTSWPTAVGVSTGVALLVAAGLGERSRT